MYGDEFIKVISFDPGNNLGVSIFCLDPYTLNIVNIETKLFILNNSLEENEDNKHLIRLNTLNNIITNLMYIYKPTCIALETSFLNMRFPKAVIQLSQYVATIEMAAYTANRYIKFFRYMPKYIKKNIGAGGNADKDDMTIAVRNIPFINNLIDINRLSEHEVDSLAIGYLTVEEIRRFPFILYTL